MYRAIILFYIRLHGVMCEQWQYYPSHGIRNHATLLSICLCLCMYAHIYCVQNVSVHSIKTYSIGRMNLFLIPVLDGGEWSTLHSDRFISRERVPSNK